MLVLVTGCSGALGRDICKYLSINGVPHISFDRNLLDIGNELMLYKIFKAHKVDVLINCAAYTDVAGAEKNMASATYCNVEAVNILANVCNRHNVELIHFSTDYVFDGCKDGKYNEKDETYPLNIYGKTKLQGEQIVQRTCSSYKIFRLQWLYSGYGDNFILKILSYYKQNNRVTVVEDQIGSPCSTSFVASTLVSILLSNKKIDNGVYHLTHDDFCTRYEFVKYMFSLFGKKSFVYPADSKKFSKEVIRPNNTVLDNRKIKLALEVTSLRSWQIDFDNFLRENFSIFDKYFSKNCVKNLDGGINGCS